MTQDTKHTGSRMIITGCTISVVSAILFLLNVPPEITSTSAPAEPSAWPISRIAAIGAATGLVLCLIGLFMRWRAAS